MNKKDFNLDPDKVLAAREEADEVFQMLTSHKIKVTTIVEDTRRGPVVTCRKYKPGDTPGYFKTHDCYVDEFNTEAEAQAFMDEAKKA